MDPDSPVELSSKRRRSGGAVKGHSDASGRGASQQSHTPPAPESQQPRPTLPELQRAQPPSPWYSFDYFASFVLSGFRIRCPDLGTLRQVRFRE
jgi:hypothetical protein